MKNYITALFGVIILYFINHFGTSGGYVYYRWLDLISHSLAGFCIAILLFEVFTSSLLHLGAFKHKKIFIVFVVIVVGLLWEIMEVKYDLIGYPFGTFLYWVDTVKDVIMDTIGASLGVYLFNRNGKQQ